MSFSQRILYDWMYISHVRGLRPNQNRLGTNECPWTTVLKDKDKYRTGHGHSDKSAGAMKERSEKLKMAN